MIFLQLFWEFFRAGLLAVGGGLATLPFLFQMCTTHPDWFTSATLADMIAISESTPGPIGINMATYAGFSVAGLAGGLLATFALVLPSLIIILIVARVYTKFRQSALVNDVFTCLRPVVTGVIACVLVNLSLSSMYPGGAVQWYGIGLFAFCTALAFTFKRLHPIFIILIGAAAGVFLL